MRLGLAIGAAVAMAGLLTPGAFAQPRTRTMQIITNGPYLGIGVRDIDADSAKKFNLKEVTGAEVTSVMADSPAAKAGLKEGDVVLQYNGQPVEGQEQLTRMVRETPPGRQVKIGVWRNGAMQTLTATIEERKGPQAFSYKDGQWMGPDPEQMKRLEEQFKNFRMPDMGNLPGLTMNAPSPMLGIMGEPLGEEKQLASFFGVDEGVLVKSVNHDSAAEKAGIKAGDVIIKVDDSKVVSTRDITMALRAARSKKTVTVVVVRNRKEIPITVTMDGGVGGVGTPVRARLLLPALPMRLLAHDRII